MRAFSDDVVQHALTLVEAEDGITEINTQTGEVIGYRVCSVDPDGKRTGRVYRVQTDYRPGFEKVRWITCTCKHGMADGFGNSRCYHAAAVLIYLRKTVLSQGD